jgi:glycine cleavage system aminomethyltransferase T
MSLDFLTVGAPGALARSPMERQARNAGARFEVRDGWNVAVEYPGAPDGDVGWADVSHLSKLELQGTPEAIDAALSPHSGINFAPTALAFGTALRRDGAWWCRLTPSRALVIGTRPEANRMAVDGVAGDGVAGEGVAGEGVDVMDVTSSFAALTLAGSLAREALARFCALDLRPAVAPLGALRPGSIGRQPGILIREAQERYLILFGWAIGEYMWSVVADAAGHLGGAPIGTDALTEIGEPGA